MPEVRTIHLVSSPAREDASRGCDEDGQFGVSGCIFLLSTGCWYAAPIGGGAEGERIRR
jgi:hypothetical protein